LNDRDSSGYAGAARILNCFSITAAVLETARGDLQRNGLYVDRCDIAALPNVGWDHIGIDGIETLEQVASEGLSMRHARRWC
jgi:cyanophycin synthetase